MMPIFIQNIVIKTLLNPLAALTAKVNTKWRDRAAVFSVFMMIVLEMLFGCGKFNFRYTIFFVPACFFLGLIILAGLKEKSQPVKFRIFPTVCWGVITLWMAIAAVVINHNELAELVIWLIALPIMYIVWAGEHSRLFEIFVKGVCWSFIPFCVISLLFYPISANRYGSFYENQNSTAFYLTAVFACALVGMLSTKNKWKSVGYGFCAALAAAFIYYTNARGGQIASITGAVMALATQLVEKKRWKPVLRQYVFLVILVAALIPTTIGLSQVGTSVTNFVTEMIVNSGNEQSEENTGTETAKPSVKPNISNVLGEIQKQTAEKYSGEGDSLNSYSAGRANLWIAYGKEIGLFGHAADAVVYDAAGDPISISSHMTYLQYAYRLGLPAGILLLLLHVFTGLKAIGFSARKREENYFVFPVTIISAFGAYTLVEACGSPIGRILILLYFVAIMPLLMQENDKETSAV